MAKSRYSKIVKLVLTLVLSLSMAFSLFLNCSLLVSAESLKVTFFNDSQRIPVVLFPMMSTDTGNRALPATYNGKFTVMYRFAVNTTGGIYTGTYVSNFKAIISNSLTNNNHMTFYTYQMSVDSISAPDGVNVTLLQSERYSNGGNYQLYFNLHSVGLENGYIDVGITFDVYSSSLVGQSFANAGVTDCVVSLSVSEAANHFSVTTNYASIDYKAAWLDYLITTIISNLSAINVSVNTQGKAITDKIQSQITNDNTISTNQINNRNINFTNLIKNDNTISANQIDNRNRNTSSILNALNANSKAEIADADKNADNIMNSYDSTESDSNNKKFDDSQKELQAAEDSLFGDASEGFAKLDFTAFKILDYPNVVASLTFVSGFLQSLYVNMGEFGIIVTVGMAVLIASKVIGLYRFNTDGKGG